jgi:hypothetical protein
VIPRATDDVQRKIIENPNSTPSQIQSSVILAKIRQGCDWSTVEQAATSVRDSKWISNEKQKLKKDYEPHGHDFEAVAHFKQNTDNRDPYYIYKLSYGGQCGKESFVFKTSKLKMKFALNMDRTGEHRLSKEFCYFDGKVKRCMNQKMVLFLSLQVFIIPSYENLFRWPQWNAVERTHQTLNCSGVLLMKSYKKRKAIPTILSTPVAGLQTWLEPTWKVSRKFMVHLP